MRLRVLGPLILDTPEGPKAVTPRKAREVLTVLALEHPQPVRLDTLVEELWDHPPPAASNTVQAHLSRLRRALVAAGSPRPGIEGGPVGYSLTGEPQLDVAEVLRLTEVCRRAQASGGWSVAADAARRGLALIRGAPEVADTSRGAVHRAWAEDLRIALTEDLAEALIRGGNLTEAATELEKATARWPLREYPWLLLMAALARAGRPADALDRFRSARAQWIHELGLDPTSDLVALEGDILHGRTPDIPTRRKPHMTRPVSLPPGSNDTPVIDIPVHYVMVHDEHVAYATVGPMDPSAPDIIILFPGALPLDAVGQFPILASRVADLASWARITWFDRRGVGLSDRRSVRDLPTRSDWLADLLAVADAVGANHPVLMAEADTIPLALEAAALHANRIGCVVLSNAYPRFTRGEGYPYGLDPTLVEQSTADVTSPEAVRPGFDLLRVIAPSMADNAAFRKWWDDAGHRGASPQVARALRLRHQREDVRDLLARVSVPVLHLVNPGSLSHDPGHRAYLEEHLPDVETVELPGPDEIWWLDASGVAVAAVKRFAHAIQRA